ncbi:MAG: carboxypeptidase regulatory-like domain-containing protein [Bacteroidia bacterium]|nr:carboxypeptidase regulatory-like domain-containing protein [Bacteroidia bacterium]
MKMKIYLLFVFLISIKVLVFSQENKAKIDILDNPKLILAKQTMYGGKYKSAIKQFKELYDKSPANSELPHYIGYCYYEIGDMTNAATYFKEAESNGAAIPETYLYLGLIYQKQSNFEKALEKFNQYKSKVNSKKQLEESDVEVYIAQCNNAIQMKQSPVPVSIINMGQDINSAYDDATPCISADGKILVFNSRRPEDPNSPMDVEGDGKYFQDIYISTFDTVNKKWTPAQPVPGNVNTDAHDAVTSISPDGKMIFIYKNDTKDNQSLGGDIFVSKVMKNKWKTPEPIGKPINSTYWEGGACLSPDGKTLYFTSERKGGFGHSDIWMSTKINNKEWSKPVNLGKTVNTPYDEVGLFMAPDGKTLFFASNGPGSMGGYDIFKTTYENGQWTTPVNLGYPINTEFNDGPISIDASGKIAYISSDRPGGVGEKDIYMINISEYPLIGNKKERLSNGLSILKGTVRDGFEGFGISDAKIEVYDDKDVLVYSTTTNENGEYFLTLAGDKSYTIKANAKGFQGMSEKIYLPTGKEDTYILVKDFLLKK